MKNKISQNQLHYSFGATFSGVLSWWGIVFITCGIILNSYENHIVGAILIIVGVSLFISIKGVIIDIRKRKVKSYYLFLFFKIGIWKDLINYNTIVLQRFTDISTISYRSHSSTTSIRIFELYLIGKNSTKILLTEFKKYKEANENLIQCGKLLDLPILNRVK
jgi:hypothetical protein